MIPLTDDQKIKHEESKRCYLCNQSFNTNKQSKYYKNYKKLEIIVIIQVYIEVLHILYVI